MAIAVMPGVKITKYFASFLWAISPKIGLKSDGIFLAISKKAACVNEIPNFSIKSGKMGGRRAEKISCAK
jgi:hypothetical protein